MKRLEHALQIAVAHMLEVILVPGVTWWTSIDHGVGRLGFAEAGIRKRRGVKPGLPDIMIMVGAREKSVYRVIGIELKVGGGKPTDTQVEVADRWFYLGFRIYVARDLQTVQKILEECRVPLRNRMTFFDQGVAHADARRFTKTWHQRPKRRRKSEGRVPVVLAGKAQA
jgi:hypothetical protein